jgi:hypothetical protein
MPPILLDARELGERLRVRPETILSWARKGHIPTLRGAQRTVLFNLDHVIEALRARRVGEGRPCA